MFINSSCTVQPLISSNDTCMVGYIFVKPNIEFDQVSSVCLRWPLAHWFGNGWAIHSNFPIDSCLSLCVTNNTQGLNEIYKPRCNLQMSNTILIRVLN